MTRQTNSAKDKIYGGIFTFKSDGDAVKQQWLLQLQNIRLEVIHIYIYTLGDLGSPMTAHRYADDVTLLVGFGVGWGGMLTFMLRC